VNATFGIVAGYLAFIFLTIGVKGRGNDGTGTNDGNLSFGGTIEQLLLGNWPYGVNLSPMVGPGGRRYYAPGTGGSTPQHLVPVDPNKGGAPGPAANGGIA
jgi:hypothetical protein